MGIEAMAPHCFKNQSASGAFVRALTIECDLRGARRSQGLLSSAAMAAAFLAFAAVIPVRAQAPAQELAVAPVEAPSDATPLSADNEIYTLLGPAEAGDAQTQFALGNHYFDGRGVAQDYGQALAWYRKSADQNYAPALNQLGYMHQHKAGLPLNYKRALYFYHLAASKSYARAEYNLGAMYQSGLGVKRDLKLAFEWFRKAADQNLADAENEVGYAYQCGCGVKRDYDQAFDWYRRAASHGNSNAEANLGFMAEKGWGQPQSYDQAFSWYYKAAEHGNAAAMDNIGFNFQNGVGVAVDYGQAWSWLYRGAALGSAAAENQLGWMYQYGQGVKQDDALAVAWYRLSDNLGNTDADTNLRNLCVDLEQRGDELCDSGAPVNDRAIELVQRRVSIRDLRNKITGLETDALQDEMNADELANMGTNSKHAHDNVIGRGITKFFDSVGTVVGAPARVQAPILRQQAALLREQLAQLERLDQLSRNVPAP
jgi:TPR repeat protein